MSTLLDSSTGQSLQTWCPQKFSNEASFGPVGLRPGNCVEMSRLQRAEARASAPEQPTAPAVQQEVARAQTRQPQDASLPEGMARKLKARAGMAVSSKTE